MPPLLASAGIAIVTIALSYNHKVAKSGNIDLSSYRTAKPIAVLYLLLGGDAVLINMATIQDTRAAEPVAAITLIKHLFAAINHESTKSGAHDLTSQV